jgi:DNA-binding response OmpR family regulator
MPTLKPRILCVDDEPTILDYLEAILTPTAYEVVRAENGEEALEKITKERIELVLLDVGIPKVDGFEVCRTIKGDKRYQDIPVIMITGFAEGEERIKGIEAGAEEFLSKPLRAKEILARTKMLLKARVTQQRRIGELLIEMGFITEQQLEEALVLAKDQDIKVGEALYRMGVLDKDRLYWVLSTQLNMNYVEISPEMINRKLIEQFPINLLEELLCLPLYETQEEIHVAIADPTDQEIVKKAKDLRPGKTVQLHLALPEKVRAILDTLKTESCPEGLGAVGVSGKISESEDLSKMEYFWSGLITTLFTMSPEEDCWIHRTLTGCRLISQKGNQMKILHEYPEGIYALIKGRLKQNLSSQSSGREKSLFLEERMTKQQGAFKWWELGCLHGGLVRIRRIPTFCQETFKIVCTEDWSESGASRPSVRRRSKRHIPNISKGSKISGISSTITIAFLLAGKKD